VATKLALVSWNSGYVSHLTLVRYKVYLYTYISPVQFGIWPMSVGDVSVGCGMAVYVTGDGKCVICDSYVRPCTLVRICDECNYGSYQGRCVICGGPGVSDAYYCKECTITEKDVSTIAICACFSMQLYRLGVSVACGVTSCGSCGK